MKLEKPVMWLVNLLLSAFFAFGVLAFAEQFARTGWAWYSHSLRCWPLLFCFPLGLVGRALPRLKLPLLAVAAVGAGVAVGLLVGALSFLNILYFIIAGVMGGVLYLMGLRGDEAFPSGLAIASILVYVGACAFFFLGDYQLRDFEPLCWCALMAFTLSLYSFNAASLYTGVHNAKGGEVMSIPAGIRGKNLLLLTGFLVVAMLIGNLGALHRFLDGTWRWIVSGITIFINFLANLQGGGSDTPSGSTPVPTEAANNFDIVQIENTGTGTFVTVYAVLLGLGCVLFFLLAYGFAKEGRQGGGLRRLGEALRRLLKTRQVLEYEDDVEKLTDFKGILRERRKRAKKLWQKLTVRPQRFEDMPNDRMRVRFAYKALLKSGRVAGWTPSATPNEVGAALSTDALKTLTGRYNAARYDLEEELPPEAAEEARRALKSMRG